MLQTKILNQGGEERKTPGALSERADKFAFGDRQLLLRRKIHLDGPGQIGIRNLHHVKSALNNLLELVERRMRADEERMQHNGMEI